MIISILKDYFGELFLALSIVITAAFSYWLWSDNEDERIRHIAEKYEKFHDKGDKEKAEIFLEASLPGGTGPIDPIWSRLVHTSKNGYNKLHLMMRIVAGNPKREASYKQVATLIELAPQSFQDEVKERYLLDLQAIPGVDYELLEQYDLLATAQ